LTGDKKNVIDVINIDHYDINHTLEIMLQADYGSHYIIVYPNLSTLRRVYSNYSKMQLENKNDIVLLLPFYETTESVRKILSGGFHDAISSLDVGKNEKDGSLVIVDSKKAYFGSKTIVDIKTFVGMLIEHAKHSQKTGVCVIADMGAFFYFNKIQELVKYEITLPPKFDLNLKAFCCYHESDFSNYLIREQDHNLLHHHGKAIIMNTTSSN
jgi:MEDS: MEthanogen/methylotroph, DcmR Sensory domain